MEIVLKASVFTKRLHKNMTLVLFYYGFQTVCKCPFRALLVTSATDSNQTWAN